MAPLRAAVDHGEHKLCALSGNPDLPKWGFGSAPRFGKSPRQKGKQSLATSHYSTATATTAVPPSADTVELPDDERSPTPPDDRHERAARVHHALTGGWTVGNFVTRFDGGSDRFVEPPDRACNPRPKQYTPAATIGSETSVKFPHAAKYSFAGGKSRTPVARKKGGSSPSQLRKSASEGSAVKELAEFLKKAKGPSRGFGTCERIRYRGSHLELPESPGPAAYELARACDMPAQWQSSTTVPWGKRTGKRPTPGLSLGSKDVGPGEYTAHHTFLQSAGPAPTFAHPLRTLSKGTTPDPGQYDCKSFIGTEAKYGFGTGGRSETSKRGSADEPGPGTYYADMRAVSADTRCATFSKGSRAHPCDDLDPDEPPGPGAYEVRWEPKASDKPSTGLPKDEKRSLPGMGPLGIPGPGQYNVGSSLGGVATGVHHPLPRGIEDIPGPGEYDPSDHLTREAGPSWRSPQYTTPRRPPWEQHGESEASGHQALINRAIKAAEAAKGGALNTGPGVLMKLEGSKYSLGVRREYGAALAPRKLYSHAMVGSFSAQSRSSSAAAIPRAAAEAGVETDAA